MNSQNSSSDNLLAHNQGDLYGLPLDQLSLHIGDSLQLQIGNICYFVRLIGYLKEQSVIVTMPDEKGNPVRPDKGLSLVVRFFIDKRAYSFNSVVNQISNEPFSHLHLAYPIKTLVLEERQYERVRVNISGTADIQDGTSVSCLVHDISIGGALIVLHNQTGSVNDPVLLTLRVVVNGVEYELSLDSEIRSVRSEGASNDSEALILHGLAFHDLSRQDILALAAFDLLPNWKGTY